MKWTLQSKTKVNQIEILEKVLLTNRNILAKEKENFFIPVHPKQLKMDHHGISDADLRKAKKLVLQAIAEEKKIVIFGDYDADGICASAILWQTLFFIYKKMHPKGENFPVPFIPHREKHGYGLSIPAVSELIELTEPDLIITVDNGIVAHDAAKFVQKQNISLIVTDHHQVETKDGQPKYPPADAIVHSTKLCGATVAWYFANSLNKKMASISLDLAAVATIADQVPLLEANRSFAYHGLLALQKTKRLGIIELLKTMSVKQAEISEWTVGYGIAPRINAMGRMEHGLDALRLLCTTNESQAQKLAAKLSETNTLRQDVTQEMKLDAIEQAKKQSEEKIIVVSSQDYHEGVIGLIAGELLQKYHKPVIAISVGEQVSKASVRSVSGFSVVDFLRTIQDKFLSVGGHPMAAGFSFETKKLTEITEKLFELAQAELSDELLEKEIEVDCELSHEMITIQTVDTVENFAPFGMKNPVPLFLLNNLQVISKQELGKSGKHFKLFLQLAGQEKSSVEAVLWNKPHLVSDIESKDKISVIASIEKNTWNGNEKAQLKIIDIQK